MGARTVDPGVYDFAKDWIERSGAKDPTPEQILSLAKEVQQVV